MRRPEIPTPPRRGPGNTRKSHCCSLLLFLPRAAAPFAIDVRSCCTFCHCCRGLLHLLPFLPGAAAPFAIATIIIIVIIATIIRIRSTPEGDGGFYERAFARLEGHGPSKDKEDAEVALLKIQAKLCEEDLVTKKATSKGAQIANLKSVMETGQLDEEEMAVCRKTLYKLATDLS